ncbi:MAG TPA: type 1 glutamine amidotransferase domain-containing protein [Terriglobales bacterium]|jgi:protease I
MASANELSGLRIAALLDNYFEQAELTGPKTAFENAGARVDIISRIPQPQGVNHHERGDTFHAAVALADARPENYDALLLPGGVVNGDSLRIVPEAQRLAKAMVGQGKPVAVICHGGWLLISCNLVRGRTLTSWPTLQDDYRNAGANWVDKEVVVDGNWISSRKPADIPAFNRAAIEVFARSRGEKAA